MFKKHKQFRQPAVATVSFKYAQTQDSRGTAEVSSLPVLLILPQ